jgi:hypothetical protein
LPGAVAAGPTNANAVIEVSVKVRCKKALLPLTGRSEAEMTREQLADQYGAEERTWI